MRLSELESILPSFDDMEKLVRVSAETHFEAAKLVDKIKQLEAQYIRECILVQKYWPRGKRPTDSGSYLNKVVPRLGNTPEQKLLLESKRKELAKYKRQAAEADNLLDIAKSKIAVFQTLSANKRQSLAL